MTLTELKYIVAVAREKHFGRAADACFVSQPTLSVAIKKLEEELDVKLFERSANEVAVTDLGEEIVRQAQSVLEQAANIKEIAKRGKNPLAGPLNLLHRALPVARFGAECHSKVSRNAVDVARKLHRQIARVVAHRRDRLRHLGRAFSRRWVGHRAFVRRAFYGGRA